MADDTQVDVEKPAEVTPEVKPKAETIAEIIAVDPKPEPKLVPEAALLEEKKGRKAAEREIKNLRDQIAKGDDAQIAASLEEIGEEFNVDKKFLGKLASTIRSQVEAETETRFNAKLKPFEEKDRADKIQTVFSTHFEKAMAEMEDYKGIVNRDAIFALSLNPANASKTLPQLIEETYGNAIAGKRSIETTTPRGGAASGEFDFDRANTDSAYLDEVMKDPALKTQFDAKVMEIARRA